MREFPPEAGDGIGHASDGRRPSILFINQHYWPDCASTGQHLTDLAEHLAAVGYDVHVLCSRGGYLAGKVPAAKREIRNGVTVRRLGGTAFGRDTHLGRIADYASFYLQVVAQLLFGRRFDLVVVLTTPPLLSSAAALAKSVRRVEYGVWSMDLHPDAEFAIGMLSPTGLAGRTLEALNAWGYRRADFVVDLGACMKRRLLDKGVDSRRLHTIPVWSRADEVVPVTNDVNPLRSELGLEGRFVVMYSGNAGLAHCFEEVLAAAVELRDEDDIRFVFVGGGPRRAQIERFVAEHGLTNVAYLEYFPREQIRYSLPLGDMHLLTLRQDFAGIAVPGKLYGIMAAGRPILMVGPTESASARTILQERIGEVIPPGSADGGLRLAESIRAYHRDPDRLRATGYRARDAFLSRYEQTVTCDAWARLIDRHLGVYMAPGTGDRSHAHDLEPSLSPQSS